MLTPRRPLQRTPSTATAASPLSTVQSGKHELHHSRFHQTEDRHMHVISCLACWPNICWRPAFHSSQVLAPCIPFKPGAYLRLAA